MQHLATSTVAASSALVQRAICSCFQGALVEESEVENPRDPSLFEGPDKDRQVRWADVSK